MLVIAAMVDEFLLQKQLFRILAFLSAVGSKERFANVNEGKNILSSTLS